MSDVFPKAKRSEIMRKVKNRNTDIELIVRKGLFRRGYRYKLKSKLFGKPDIVFPSEKIAIFCDGDFWHGKNYAKEKKNYKSFWKEKILVNIERDKNVNKILKKQGWKVIRFWKTEILKSPDKCIKKIEKFIKLRKI